MSQPRPRRSLPPKTLEVSSGGQLPPWLFDQSGGVQVSGDSGSGKSTFLCVVMALLARLGYGFTCFDPHGDLVQKVKRLCLNMGESVTRRLYEISPGNTSIVTKFNPLAVDRTGLDDYTWRARLTEKCGHAARILLHAWGEGDFNSKPTLYKWVNRILMAVALLGLPFAAVRHFLEVGSPLYRSLTALLPDFLTRLEFAELDEMRPRDREELIASTKNRFLGFLSNTVVEAALSCEGGIRADRLIQDNAIILVDLSQQNVLRAEDQEIFANLWLSEILHAVFGTPEHERVPHWVVIDELPVFTSCAPLITTALRQVRKFRTRFVCAHQGVNFFEGQAEDRLLHALVGQCGIHLMFRHIDPLDAMFFAQILSLPSFSPTKVKHVLRQKQQYQADSKLITLTDHSESTSEGENSGGSQSTGTTETDTNSRDTSRTTARSDNRSPSGSRRAETNSEGEGHRQSNGHSSGTTQTTGSNWSHSTNSTRGRTRKQTLVPVFKWRNVVTSITFLTPDEQTIGGAALLSRLVTGEAVLYAAGGGIRKVKIPMLRDPFALTPKFADRTLSAFRAQLLRRSAYELPGDIPARQQAIVQACLDRMSELSLNGQLHGISGSSPQVLLPHQCGSPEGLRIMSRGQTQEDPPLPPSPLTI